MTRASNLRTGGQILVDQLEIHGADLAFVEVRRAPVTVLQAHLLVGDVPGDAADPGRQAGAALEGSETLLIEIGGRL